MQANPLSSRNLGVIAAACALLATQPLSAGNARPAFDPLFDARPCAARPVAVPPALLRLVAAKRSETTPFQPAPMAAAAGEVPLYRNLGTLSWRITTRQPKAQAYFDQGLRLAFGFNHAEAQRAFRAAQRFDPQCAMCFWGEALILGPNINVPMQPEAQAPALEALARAVALKDGTSERERGLIEALQQRYSADPKAERAALDAAYADAMQELARRHPRDDLILTLAAEAAMDTQPWDYWQAGGAQPKGRGEQIVTLLETVLRRNPNHMGAIHLYIHAVEASARPERALAPARRLAAQAPGAGHLVHMPAHIYYRVGMYRESLAANVKAVEVDERYFGTSPSDPLYRSAYYPHNIHFVMVSAQMGGDARTALDAAVKLDGVMPDAVVQQFPIMQPVKGAPYTTYALFAAPAAVLALPAPPPQLLLVRALYHYARALAFVKLGDDSRAEAEIDAIARLERDADFKPFEAWGVPAPQVLQTARLVASARLADRQGRLDDAARAYEQAVAIEDALAYMEPPYWYYPVRQSLGALYLRQGKLDDARQVLRESLARVPNNGWALAALVEVERRQGESQAAATAQRAYQRAWFGPAPGPDLKQL